MQVEVLSEVPPIPADITAESIQTHLDENHTHLAEKYELVVSLMQWPAS